MYSPARFFSGPNRSIATDLRGLVARKSFINFYCLECVRQSRVQVWQFRATENTSLAI